VHGSSSGPRPGRIHLDSAGIGHRALAGQRQQPLRDPWGYGIDHERIGPFIRHAGFTRHAEGGGASVAREDTAGAGQEGVADTSAHANPNTDHPADAAADLPNPGSNSNADAHCGANADADTGTNAHAHRRAGANTDSVAHTPADSNTTPNANPNGNTGANADANRATNPDTDSRADTYARPDADSATGRHPGDAAGQLIVRADPLDVARQRRPRPDLPQRTPDR
jgi:hypothetical protein